MQVLYGVGSARVSFSIVMITEVGGGEEQES